MFLIRAEDTAVRCCVEADCSCVGEYYLGVDDAVAECAVFDVSGEGTATRYLSAVEQEG